MSATQKVGRSGWYILGKEVDQFEKSFADWTHRKHVVGCANGMDALEMGLRAAGIKPGDAVLTTPLSAFATALCIVRAGGEPVYCDVDAHGLLDPEQVRRALKEHPKIRFIMPVHLFGHVADLDALGDITREHGITMIEDAAQAHGAQRNGVRAGDVGRATGFSFYPTKNLGAIGDAGALATDDPEIAQAVHTLRNYGQSKKYVHDEIGLNSRLDELHAAIMNEAFLPRLADWTARRRAIARAYLDGISNPRIQLLPGPDHDGSVWHLFPVMVAENADRDAFMAHLRQAGVQAGQHYPKLMPHQRAMTERSEPPRVVGELPIAQSFADREVSLPIHPYLTDDEVKHVIDTVDQWTD
ncbi:MAG: DegT/DnrJ/EryC1/StrS family aminotransferase [Myxococcota bacterium]